MYPARALPDPLRLANDLKQLASRLKCRGDIVDRAVNLLTRLHMESRTTVSHAALQLAATCTLASLGEFTYEENSCDIVFSAAGLAVEVETGFIPPRYALMPKTYIAARAVAKLAKCSSKYPYQALVYPAHIDVELPLPLLKKPLERTRDENAMLYNIARRVYQSITISQVARINLVGVLVVDIDRGRVYVVPPLQETPKTPNPLEVGTTVPVTRLAKPMGLTGNP